MKELNDSKIDRFRNSVRCGFCKMLWGLERWDYGDFYSCKRCGTDMVMDTKDPMPTRDSLLKIISTYDTKLSSSKNKQSDANKHEK